METFKGVTFGYYGRNGFFSSKIAREHVDHIAELNIPWVCLISTVMQDAFYSTRMYRDFYMTPNDSELEEIIGYIHGKGIKVMLRPMIECWDGTQRYHINTPQGEVYPDRPFSYCDKWFESYTHLVTHYSKMAEKTGCEAYGYDSELNQLVSFSENWLKLIDHTRKIYKGHITSSFIRTEQYIKKLENKNFWFNALDSLGTSMYYPASQTGGGSVESMVEFLGKNTDAMEAFAQKLKVPFYFGECGCCATENATKLPYFWKNGKKYDGEEQAKYLEAVIRAYSSTPWWHGMFWWKWDENNFRPEFVEDPAGDKGFTIYGKPAANVMKRWCSE